MANSNRSCLHISWSDGELMTNVEMERRGLFELFQLVWGWVDDSLNLFIVFNWHGPHCVCGLPTLKVVSAFFLPDLRKVSGGPAARKLPYTSVSSLGRHRMCHSVIAVGFLWQGQFTSKLCWSCTVKDQEDRIIRAREKSKNLKISAKSLEILKKSRTEASGMRDALAST